MNCRQARTHLFAERDRSPDETERAALESHLAICDGCRRVRENLTAALAAWRTEIRHAKIPNAEREWHAVRRRMRGGDEAGATRTSRSRRNLFAWLVLPLGAAAAAVFAFLAIAPGNQPTQTTAQIAHANSVEVSTDNATTVFVVDDKSGWLFVWASDPNPRSG